VSSILAAIFGAQAILLAAEANLAAETLALPGEAGADGPKPRA